VYASELYHKTGLLGMTRQGLDSGQVVQLNRILQVVPSVAASLGPVPRSWGAATYLLRSGGKYGIQERKECVV
jgi:hypothetical protein